jgi:hypothetical protein
MVDDVLNEGARRAIEESEITMDRVRTVMKLKS